MMKFNRKFILTVLLVVFLATIAILLWIFTQSNKPASGEPLQQDPLLQAVPTIPAFTGGFFPIQLALTEKDVNLPKELPLLMVSNSSNITQEQAVDIAKRAGFIEAPRIIQSPQGENVYIWVQLSDALTISGITNEIHYTLGGGYPIKGLFDKKRDTEIIATAKDAMIKKGFIDPDEETNPIDISYIFSENSDDLKRSSKENANIATVNFKSGNQPYKLIGLEPNLSLTTVSIFPDGTPLEIKLKKDINYEVSDKKYPIKSFEAMRLALPVASLISTSVEYYEPQSNDIVYVSIERVEIAYFSDELKNNIYQPVFLFTGKIKTTTYPDELDATLYLPAIDSPLLYSE